MTDLKEYQDYSESLKTSKDSLSNLRYGTQDLIVTALQPVTTLDWLFTLFLGIISAYTSIAQILLALSIILKVPSVSVFIIAKEVFGVFVIATPALEILKTKPPSHVYEALFSPKLIENVLQTIKVSTDKVSSLRPFLFTISMLSNARNALSLAIAVRWKQQVPFNSIESQIGRVGNFAVLAFSLVLDIKSTNRTLNFFFLFSVFFNVLLGILGGTSIIKTQLSMVDFLHDVEEGKVEPTQYVLALEGIHQNTFGESSQEKIPEALLTQFNGGGVPTNPVDLSAFEKGDVDYENPSSKHEPALDRNRSATLTADKIRPVFTGKALRPHKTSSDDSSKDEN